MRCCCSPSSIPSDILGWRGDWLRARFSRLECGWTKPPLCPLGREHFFPGSAPQVGQLVLNTGSSGWLSVSSVSDFSGSSSLFGWFVAITSWLCYGPHIYLPKHYEEIDNTVYPRFRGIVGQRTLQWTTDSLLATQASRAVAVEARFTKTMSLRVGSASRSSTRLIGQRLSVSAVGGEGTWTSSLRSVLGVASNRNISRRQPIKPRCRSSRSSIRS